MGTGDKKPVELTVDVKRVTDAAILALVGEEEVWLPKSQIMSVQTYDQQEHIQDAFDITGSTEGLTIEIPQWLAYKKGLI